MKPNQVDVLAAAVSCDTQELLDAVEPGFSRQIVCDLVDGHRFNGVDDDVSLVHGIPATNFHTRPYPDANATSDSAAPDSLSKTFRE